MRLREETGPLLALNLLPGSWRPFGILQLGRGKNVLVPNHSWLCLSPHQVVQCLPVLVSSHLSPTSGGRYSRSYGQGTGTCHVSTLAVRSWSKGPWVPLPGDYSSSIPRPCHSWIPTLASFLTPGLLYYLVVLRTDHITTLFRHLPWLPDTCE